MALSPNYGWSEPDNSSLVKNGAADIRTLGDAIDTSLWNVGFGQAGKNKIINGDFGIWQRGTSFSNPANDTYQADRWTVVADGSGATKTVSQQSFTVGTAPVAGYESQFFYRFAQTVAGSGATYNVIRQKIENVRTFAGNTVTLSFWAKADAPRTINTSVVQNFGSGGSSQVETSGTAASVTTSWARYSTTIAVPSITGKTVGASSWLAPSLLLPINTTMTIDIWGVQLEYGSKATPFQTATGTIQGELAACQRYYWRTTQVGGYSTHGTGYTISTTGAYIQINFPTAMRVIPSSVDYSTLAVQPSTGTVTALSSVSFDQGTNLSCSVAAITSSSWVTSLPARILNNGSTSGYIGFSAEL